MKKDDGYFVATVIEITALFVIILYVIYFKI